MAQDDWGATAAFHVFDPSAILALQFKLPAVVSGGMSYSFCTEQLGITL